jgi:hypothetical protein
MQLINVGHQNAQVRLCQFMKQKKIDKILQNTSEMDACGESSNNQLKGDRLVGNAPQGTVMPV